MAPLLPQHAALRSPAGQRDRAADQRDGFEAPTEVPVVEGLLRRLLAASTVTAAAQAAVDTVRDALDADVSWCGVVSGDTLRLAAYSGLRTSEMPALWHLKVGQGIGGRVAKEGRTIACRDYRRDPRRVPVMKSIIDGEGIRGGACAPLTCGAEVLGVLYACNRVPRDWTTEELWLLTGIAHDTGTALGRIRERHQEQQLAEATDRKARCAASSLDLIGAIAMSLARTDDLAVGIGVLAHHLGRHVELLEPGGERLYKAPPGADRDERALMQVEIGDEPFGILRVSGEQELGRADREMVGICADLIALQLLRERADLRAESRVHSEFLDDLLEGRFDDRADILARAALLGIDLETPRYVACVGVHLPMESGSDDAVPVVSRRLVGQVERHVRRRFPRSVVNPRSGDIVVLLDPGDQDLQQVHKGLREVVGPREGKPNNLVAGIGRMCLGLEDYADSYAEASVALDLARRRSTWGEVLSPADLGLYGLLGRGSTRHALESIVESALGPIIEADATGGSEYVRTLHAYLDADRHLERTAAYLHVHPNTVRYRLAKVQDMLGVNLRDVDDRFLLELALRVQSALEHH